MGDGLFFIFAIIGLFILWVVTGGPTKPISFTGPFITPITNIGQTQNAYGPKIPVGGSISAAGASVSIGEKNNSSTKIPNTSPYAGSVFLTHFVSGLGNSNPAQEYLTLQVSTDTKNPINISGWKIISAVTGTTVVIPEGVQYLKLGTVSLAPIVIAANSMATITTGFSPVNVSYEENSCTGMLSDQVEYANCFAEHANDSAFLTGTWRIYLNKGVRLWRDQGETIELQDQNGEVVDSFSY